MVARAVHSKNHMTQETEKTLKGLYRYYSYVQLNVQSLLLTSPTLAQSPYSTLSTSKQKQNKKKKQKKKTNSNNSSDSSCYDSDSEFEYVLVKRKPKQQYISNQRGREDCNQEITSKKPESGSDKSETIEQATRPKQNRRPKQVFTYDTLGKPSYHNIDSLQYSIHFQLHQYNIFLSHLTHIHQWHGNSYMLHQHVI